MIQLRKGTFETNSSSTHSISYNPNKGLEPSTLKIAEDGYIHTWLEGYGWEWKTYCSQEDRLSYLVTMLSAMQGDSIWCINDAEIKRCIQELMESAEFQNLSKEISEYTGARGIVVDFSEGYVDHRSVKHSSIDKFLEHWDMSNILEFVFGDTIIHTGNDNDGYGVDWT